MGFLSKLGKKLKHTYHKNRRVRELRHAAEEHLQEEAEEWVEKKLGYTTPIPGGSHDADGEPYETHHLPDDMPQMTMDDLRRIRERRRRQR